MPCPKNKSEEIVIQFNRECLDCGDEQCRDTAVNNINIYLSSHVTPVHLVWILTRAIIGALIASSSSMHDLLYNACYLSSNLAEEIQSFKDNKFGIKVHVKSEIKKENLN